MKNIFKKKLAVKILLLVELLIAIIISTNICAITGKYYYGKVAKASGYNYVYSGMISLTMSDGIVKESYSENDITLYRDKLEKLLLKLTTIGGNISCDIGGNVANGAGEVCKVYVNADEDIAAPMESGTASFASVSGAYVGNGLKKYISNNSIIIFGNDLTVAGIMSSYGFEQNTEIYVKLSDMSESTRVYIEEYILKTLFFEPGTRFYFTYESNQNGVDEVMQFCHIVEEDFSEFVCNFDEQVPEYKSEYTSMLMTIRNVFYIIVAVVCVSVIFRTMLIWMHEQHSAILVFKTFGMNDIKMLMPLFAEFGIVWIASFIMSGIAEFCLYRIVRAYDIALIIKYWLVASVICAFMGALILTVAYIKVSNSKKNLSAQLAEVEV